MSAKTPDNTVSPLVIKGVAWNGTARLATRGIQFVVTLVLARLLVPADFGLAAMASVVTMFGGMISEMGFGVAVVQKRELSAEDTSTAFWTSVLLGVVITAGCILTAPLAAAAFNNATVSPIIAWSSVGLMIGALAVTPQAMLVRRLEFRSIALAEITSSLTYAVIAVTMAAQGFGVWSLVIAGLVLGVVRTALLYSRSRVRPRLWIRLDSLREILPFGMRMFGANLVQYVRSNLDYFVVGSLLGPAALGLYTLAFKLADFPRLRLASSVTEVALPKMSSLQDEDDQVVLAYLKSLTGVTLITFPLLIGLAMLAPEFIHVAYGSRWDGAITPLQILLLMGLLLSISDAMMTTIVAKGHAETNLSLSLWYLAAVGVLATVGVRWGIVGVALGVSAATAIYLALVQRALSRLLAVGLTVTLRSMALPATACAGMAAVLLLVRSLAFELAVPTTLWLPLAVALGAAAYFAVVLLAIGPAQARDAYRALRRRGADRESPTADVIGA